MWSIVAGFFTTSFEPDTEGRNSRPSSLGIEVMSGMSYPSTRSTCDCLKEGALRIIVSGFNGDKTGEVGGDVNDMLDNNGS